MTHDNVDEELGMCLTEFDPSEDRSGAELGMMMDEDVKDSSQDELSALDCVSTTLIL